MTGVGAFQVGIETEEAREVHEEDQVKVGIVGLATVQPLNTVGYIVEHRLVALLTAQGMIEKLGKEKADGQLRGIGEQGRQGREDSGIVQLLQLRLLAHIALKGKQRKRLEVLLLQLAMRALRHRCHKRQPPMTTRIDIGNDLLLTIFDGSEDDGIGGNQHIPAYLGNRGTPLLIFMQIYNKNHQTYGFLNRFYATILKIITIFAAR